MKTSNSILSKELGLPLKKALKILNLLTHAGLITRIVTKEGARYRGFPFFATDFKKI